MGPGLQVLGTPETKEPPKIFVSCSGSAEPWLQDALDHEGDKLIMPGEDLALLSHLPRAKTPLKTSAETSAWRRLGEGTCLALTLHTERGHRHSPRAGIPPGTSCLWRNTIKLIPAPWGAPPGSEKTPKMQQARKQRALATPSVPSQGTAAEMKNALSRGKAQKDVGCWAGGWHLSLRVPLQKLCLCLSTAGSQVPAGGRRGERPHLSFPLRRASK